MSVRQRILMIEVEKSVSETVKTNLDSDKIEVLTADDSLEGIDLIYNRHAEIIILDGTKKSDLDAYYLIKSFREEPPASNPVIILLVREESVEEMRKAVKTGADFCIAKSADSKELCSRITTVLRKKRRIR